MTVVPYYPLGDTVLKKIIELKLKQIGDRLRQNYKAPVHLFADGGGHHRVALQGRRNRRPQRRPHHHRHGPGGISNEVLARIAEGHPVKKVAVDVDDKSQFTFAVE